jgi:hypothetical protein
MPQFFAARVPSRSHARSAAHATLTRALNGAGDENRTRTISLGSLGRGAAMTS